MYLYCLTSTAPAVTLYQPSTRLGAQSPQSVTEPARRSCAKDATSARTKTSAAGHKFPPRQHADSTGHYMQSRPRRAGGVFFFLLLLYCAIARGGGNCDDELGESISVDQAAQAGESSSSGCGNAASNSSGCCRTATASSARVADGVYGDPEVCAHWKS